MTLVERCLRRYYRWSSLKFCRRWLRVRCSRPIVSFSFDDFPHTAASIGGPVLEELDIRATYFVSFGLAERMLSSGPAFTLDDVRHLVETGHELGCHTFGHELSYRVFPRQYGASIQRNQEFLRELGLNCPWRVFAYPAGSVTPGTKRIIQNRFDCGRGILPGINAGWADANLLRAYSLCDNRWPVDHLSAVMRQAAAQHGWLIFYTHDVQDDPSRFGCTPAYLREVAQAAVDSGAAILPIGEAMAEIRETSASLSDGES